MSGASQGQEVARAIEDLVKHPNQSMAATTDVPTDEASLALPPGSAVRADAASWAPDGVGGGTMIVTVTTGTAITIATPIMIMIATGAATDTIARMIIVIETTATVRAA